MRRFLVGWILSLLLVLSARCEARPLWQVPPLSSFNGASWGNLRLGQTTFRQIQANYETGKGLYERSTELTQPKNAPVRVDLLWQKRGGDEILEAISVRFDGAGPRRDAVEKLFELAVAANFYQTGRFEAWRVASLAQRGVALFTLGEGEAETAPLVLLCSPQAMGALNRLSGEATPVEERVDPRQNAPKIAEFGRIEVIWNGDDDLELPRSERNRTRDRIEEADASGTLRFYSASDGKYEVRATASENGKKGGSVSVSISIVADGPYGTLRASGSDTDYWTWSKREQENGEFRDSYELGRRVRESYRDAVDAARRQAESSFARQMERSGPPPLAQIRETQWQEIIESVRQSARNEALYPGVLR